MKRQEDEVNEASSASRSLFGIGRVLRWRATVAAQLCFFLVLATATGAHVLADQKQQRKSSSGKQSTAASSSKSGVATSNKYQGKQNAGAKEDRGKTVKPNFLEYLRKGVTATKPPGTSGVFIDPVPPSAGGKPPKPPIQITIPFSAGASQNTQSDNDDEVPPRPPIHITLPPLGGTPHTSIHPPHPPHPPVHFPPPVVYVNPQPPMDNSPVVHEVLRPESSVMTNPLPEANLVPNTRSTPKPVAVTRNQRPDVSFALADPQVQDLAAQLIRQQANTDLDTLTTRLGPSAKDPKVAALLAGMRDKIANGQEISTADIKTLFDAVNNSKLPLAQGVSSNSMSEGAGALMSSSQANAVMTAAANTPPGPPSIVGPLIVIPALPEGSFVVLPGGSILSGTGGQGTLTVLDTPPEVLLGVALGTGEPTPDAIQDVGAPANIGIQILNPSENGGVVHYVLGGRRYSLESGNQQQHYGGNNTEISFDRGESRGHARYTIWDGAYSFSASDKGWDLFRRSYRLTIDNSQNDRPFNYVVENVAASVRAGETKSHTSDYPLVVRYDRGDDAREATKYIDKSTGETILTVALNPADGCWDLYPATSRTATSVPAVNEQVKNSLTKAASKSARLANILSSELQKKQVSVALAGTLDAIKTAKTDASIPPKAGDSDQK